MEILNLKLLLLLNWKSAQNQPETLTIKIKAISLFTKLVEEIAWVLSATHIELYPDSVRMRNNDGILPLSYVHAIGIPFSYGRILVQTVPRCYQSRNISTGLYPVHWHWTIIGVMKKNNAEAAVAGIVQFLLDCDPLVKLQKQKFRGISLLRLLVGRNMMIQPLRLVSGVSININQGNLWCISRSYRGQ